MVQDLIYPKKKLVLQHASLQLTNLENKNKEKEEKTTNLPQ